MNVDDIGGQTWTPTSCVVGMISSDKGRGERMGDGEGSGFFTVVIRGVLCCCLEKEVGTAPGL